MTSSVAFAAAQATTLPPYVPPWVPGRPVGDQLAPGDDPRQRQAGGDPLGDHDDVRLDVPVLDGEEPAGPSEARLDLVGDEQDPVLPGDLPEARQEPRRRDDVAALAEHRLDDDRGHLAPGR